MNLTPEIPRLCLRNAAPKKAVAPKPPAVKPGAGAKAKSAAKSAAKSQPAKRERGDDSAPKSSKKK